MEKVFQPNSSVPKISVLIILGLLLGEVYFWQIKPTSLSSQNLPQPIASTSAQPTSCQVLNSLPDKNCTPGSIDLKVAQANIDQTICVSGYTKTVRPPVSYTASLKLKLMKLYQDLDSPQNYELDHLIPLELGGNPTDPKNLWPQAYAPTPAAHEKDKVENYLHDQVCAKQLSLIQAQQEIATNWLAVYQALPQH